MTNDQKPRTLEALDEQLSNNELHLYGDVEDMVLRKVTPEQDPDGVGAYLYIDKDDGQVREVFPDLEQAVLWYFFSHTEFVSIKKEEPAPREVTLSDVYRLIARQCMNFAGYCPICRTRDLMNHDVQAHLDYERNNEPCEHSYGYLAGEGICQNCFLTEED